MTVTDVRKDTDNLTMTITAHFDAPVERVWKLWEDPRLLERWWGPPTYPATFVALDLTPGGAAAYYMTGPEGDQHHGWWRIRSVDAPHHFELEDGFADGDGTPRVGAPVMTMHVEIATEAGRTRMVLTTTFSSTEAMQQVLEMGMEEGVRQAIGQIDAILAEAA
jgi:uncharacterized protein YndB with AHSA1/START domain